jgi:hypothetical protein
MIHNSSRRCCPVVFCEQKKLFNKGRKGLLYLIDSCNISCPILLVDNTVRITKFQSLTLENRYQMGVF